MNHPFFSVIIPVYNRSNIVVTAIASVLNQTYTNFELIVVDDFSTDDTLLSISALQHPQLRILSNQHQKGACGARNTGVDAANGQWIAFLDSDDYFHPNKLMVMHETIGNHPQYQVFYSAFTRDHFNTQTIKLECTGFSGSHTAILPFKNVVRGLSVLVVEKQLLHSVGGLDEHFLARQDIDLYYRLSKHTDFYFVPTPLLHITIAENNRISLNEQKRLQGWLQFYQKYAATFSAKAHVYQAKRIVHFCLKQRRYKEIAHYTLIYIHFKVKNVFQKNIVNNHS